MNQHANDEDRLTARSVWSGFVQMLPLALFVVAFGAAFGLAALQHGLDRNAIVAMSTLTFAGYAQFAALELWGAQVPYFTMMATVFAINARHLLMGATLYPRLRGLDPARRYGIMLVASDANWAMAMRAYGRGRPGLGLLLGGGLALWLFWVLGTGLGAVFGAAVGDPAGLGLDMVMGCFLLALLAGGERNPRILAAWSVAAGASLIAWRYLPDNSHVILGALAGGAAGVLGGDRRHDR